MDSDDNTAVIVQAEVNKMNDTFSDLSESETAVSTEDMMQSCIEHDYALNYNNEPDRPAKRKDRSPEQTWSTVARKTKKISYGEIQDGLTNANDDKIEVSITCAEKLPKQFGLAKMLKAENIQNVMNVKYINAHKVLIHFNDNHDAERLTNSRVFNDNGYKSQKTMEVSQSYGVIKNIDIDLSEDEIMKDLCSETLILSVKRLKRRNTADGRWEPAESVRVCFKGSSLPSHVYIYDIRIIVSRYTYPVTQCSQCWRFGHMVKMCPSLKIVCPKCSKNHPNCESTNYCCNNCTGRHMAMAKICPVYVKERKIRDLMAEFNCSYKRAITLFVPPSPKHLDISQDPFLPTPRLASSVPTAQTTVLDGTIEKIISVPGSTATYANVVKESRAIPKKTSKAEKKKITKKAARTRDEIFECRSETSENDSRNDDQPRQGNKSKFKEQISWQILLKKLKENLFEPDNSTWEDKIKKCAGIIFEALLSLVWQYIADKPGCNLIKQLWATTTQTSL